jgi:hypothetical protein
MKSEINEIRGSIAIDTPLVRLARHRHFGQRAGLTPLQPRPLSTRERLRLRAIRQREMQVWLAADNATPAINHDQTRPSLAKVFQTASVGEQKKELVMLSILAAAALGAVGAALLDSAQFVHRWSEFVQGIRTLLS